MVLALVLTVSISFLFTQNIINFLAQPVGGLDKLKAIEVTESISVFMKVALFSGIALAIPCIALELWIFAALGLTPRTKNGTGWNSAGNLFIFGRRGIYFFCDAAGRPAFPE